MCEENNKTERKSLEEIILKEEFKIAGKYEDSERCIYEEPPRKVKIKTGIDYDVAKLMDLKRKKEFEIINLKREVDELDYEIHSQYNYEICHMRNQYYTAYKMLKEDVHIKKIAMETKLTETQIKQLVQTI